MVVETLPRPEQRIVSLVELKQLAKRMLPKTSLLLVIITSEPDFLPREIALAKVEVFARLLHEELDRQ